MAKEPASKNNTHSYVNRNEVFSYVLGHTRAPLNAIHDILLLKKRISKYDQLT